MQIWHRPHACQDASGAHKTLGHPHSLQSSYALRAQRKGDQSYQPHIEDDASGTHVIGVHDLMRAGSSGSRGVSAENKTCAECTKTIHNVLLIFSWCFSHAPGGEAADADRTISHRVTLCTTFLSRLIACTWMAIQGSNQEHRPHMSTGGQNAVV